MADTIFEGTIPPLKAVDMGDGTYAMAIRSMPDVGGTDIVLTIIRPGLKAFDNGDDTYSMAIVGV